MNDHELLRAAVNVSQLLLDAAGQVRLDAIGRRFPVDQRRFTEYAWRHGIDQAVADEVGDEALPRRAGLLPVRELAA